MVAQAVNRRGEGETEETPAPVLKSATRKNHNPIALVQTQGASVTTCNNHHQKAPRHARAHLEMGTEPGSLSTSQGKPVLSAPGPRYRAPAHHGGAQEGSVTVVGGTALCTQHLRQPMQPGSQGSSPSEWLSKSTCHHSHPGASRGHTHCHTQPSLP